jgi:hypothetical protein
MIPAVVGSTAASRALARQGRSRLRLPSDQEISTYYGDLIEPVGPARGLASPYLDIHVGAELPFRSLRTDRTKPTENCLRGPRYTFLPDVAIELMLHRDRR